MELNVPLQENMINISKMEFIIVLNVVRIYLHLNLNSIPVVDGPLFLKK